MITVQSTDPLMPHRALSNALSNALPNPLHDALDEAQRYDTYYPSGSLRLWQEALPALFDSLNDHRLKLADAAREEWRHRGWPGYALCLAAQGAAQ